MLSAESAANEDEAWCSGDAACAWRPVRTRRWRCLQRGLRPSTTSLPPSRLQRPARTVAVPVRGRLVTLRLWIAGRSLDRSRGQACAQADGWESGVGQAGSGVAKCCSAGVRGRRSVRQNRCSAVWPTLVMLSAESAANEDEAWRSDGAAKDGRNKEWR